jgi:hypothetical protein
MKPYLNPLTALLAVLGLEDPHTASDQPWPGGAGSACGGTLITCG